VKASISSELRSKVNLTVSDYYGFHNLGGDLMLAGLLEVLSSKGWVSRINVIVNEHYYADIEKKGKKK